MATYEFDFSGDTVGQAPAGLTHSYGSRAYNVVADATAIGGKALEITGAADTDYFTVDAINSDVDRANCEILLRVKPIDSEVEIRALVRGAISGSTLTGYVVGPRQATTSMNASVRNSSGVFSDIDVVTASENSLYLLSNTQNKWQNHLIQVIGGDIRVVTWADGANEPDPIVWIIDAPNTVVAAAGLVGLYSNRSGTVRVDYFSIGTGTDSAPRPPSTEPTADPGGASFAPGGTINGTYANFTTIPTGTVTLTDSQGNPKQYNAVISNDVESGGLHSGNWSITLDADPASGTLQDLLYGAINGELT